MSDDLLKRLASNYAGGYGDKRNLKAAIDRINNLKAENARLRDALKPFADEAPLWGDFPDSESLVEGWRGGPESGLKVNHLNRAREILAGTPPEEKET